MSPVSLTDDDDQATLEPLDEQGPAAAVDEVPLDELTNARLTELAPGDQDVIAEPRKLGGRQPTDQRTVFEVR